MRRRSSSGETDDQLGDSLARIAPRVGFRNQRRYEAHSSFVFRDIPVTGRVLDIGCGRGALALWAALHGASCVVGLEPEAAGSTAGSAVILGRLIDELGLGHRVQLLPLRLEDLDAAGQFDLAILYDVVNHLDETAVVHLHRDPSAVDAYVAKLRHLRALLRPGAFVIVGDCGKKSIWQATGRQGRWTRDIEWEKHQQPETWIAVFQQAGFRVLDVRWSPLYRWGRLAGNRLVQYFTTAHFVLRLRAGAEIEGDEHCCPSGRWDRRR